MDRVFETSESAITVIRAHLATHSKLMGAELDAIAEGLLPTWEDRQAVVRPPGTSALMIGSLRWVIRDDDLRLLDSILDGLAVSAGAGFFLLPKVPLTEALSAVVGIVVALVKLGQQIRLKGIWLQPSEYAVLATLHHAGQSGLSDLTLLSSLNRQRKHWTRKTLSRQLEILTDKPANDGTKVALVYKFADGRWRTSGI
jgi:hypothetical protein